MENLTSSQLADKLTKLLDAETRSVDLAAIFASLEKINHRLDKLESAQEPQVPPTPVHSSQDRFSIAEAIVDQLFAGNGAEKACAFEPNDRPCDHCSMCSSRGF
ncbi:MAG TPA: hypothetical protein VK918_00960 [Pyrinomonadaceae bacterium]|nr:hypothetical protein [Pyrinomonadaceae bacterium]